MIPKELDKYGRTVARILVDGRDLSVEIIRAGWAWHFEQYSSDWMLDVLEREAGSKKIGLWIAADAVAPWDIAMAN